MKIKNIVTALLLLITAAAQAQMPDMTLPVDKDVRMGKLDNGLTYFIRHNNWPENRANFYIAQKVGSIQEEESQRGLAHFLEHMAFNGSDNFKGNALIEWCRTKGIEFGGDLNAYTSIDQTVYNIDNVPTHQQGTIDSCLLILRDWSCGLLLEQDEIDKERGVIHEEWRMRTSANSRMLERNLPKLYPGSKYGLRYPIGLMSVVDNFKRQELVDYYHKWYHPKNQGIIVVGDVDVDQVEAEIKRLFGSIKTPDHPSPIVDEPVPDNPKPIVIIDKDKEYPRSIIELMMKHDTYPDSLKQQLPYMIENYAKTAAFSMLNQRFVEEAQKADCPFVSAQAGDDSYIFSKTKDAFSLSASPKNMEQTAQALKAAFKVVRQATEFGFTPTEYKRFQTNMLSSLDKTYSNKDKRYSKQFYNEILGYFLTNEPMPDIDFTYQTMKQVVPAIPLEAINQVLPSLVSQNDTNLVIINFNNEKKGNVYPTEAQLLGALSEARAEKIEAYVDNVKDEPLMTKLPKAGKITKEEKSKKFGYDILTLSNGVTVLLKKTDYKKDQVIMSGVGGAGNSVYGKEDYANIKAFDSVIDGSGLGNFSLTELGKALAGKIANARLSMGPRRMAVSGNSTPKDVETMLQLTYLYFTDIRKDQDSYNNIIQQYELGLKNRELSPEVAFSDSISATIYGHGWREAPFLAKDIKNINPDRILAMAKERTANANGWIFEIVGNYDEATIRPLICQYLGALPSKGKNMTGTRVSVPTKKNVDNIFYRKMETPKANSLISWFNHKMPYSLEGSIKADVAGQVLSMVYLKKIREEASAAYSCGAQASMSTADDGFHLAQIMAFCPMKPEMKDEALRIIDEELYNLAKTCDAEMLAKIKELMLKQIDDNEKTNGFWSGLIMNNYMMDLDSYTNYRAIVQGLTPEAISQFVKEFLKDSNKVSVVMLPQE
ncbi:peptidase M16 inactive domain protein [Hallella bergensis DSM 17361]|uniref:Peptidase M16 inactive domain protein n=1 Tax=Hallella bergensis DSM 17361 TaxID=585502 RepID=D1PTW5_9BACT|nr:M16 family metallopeptidase [Hallella bergensis]EFA45173.1 peptidase M16 inactive domain protein [Hallella bergensis DSM 17361]